MDLDEYRRTSLSNWDSASEQWLAESEYIAEKMTPVAQAIINRVDPRPGQTILDVAAGTGDLTFLVAERVGEGGRVISTDFAPGMVEAAAGRVAERGYDHVETRVLDAERMDLDDDSVDGVVCRFGYMLMADPGQALTETRRVLRDGGRLSFAVWATPDRNLWAAIPAMALVARGALPPPEPGTPSIFALADTALIQELASKAGFSDCEIEQVEVPWGYEHAGRHWELTMKLAAPLAEAFNSLDASEQESVRDEVQEKVGELVDDARDIGLAHVVTAS